MTSYIEETTEETVKKIRGFRLKYSSHKEVIEKLYLKAFINSFERIKQIQGINKLSENDIRDKFQYDLEHSNPTITEYISNNTITFNSEAQIIEEKYKFRTDIKLFCAYFMKHFIIECKCLESASQVYIKGNYNKSKDKYEVNGIERFITLTYAKGERYAGMLGFIVKGNPEKIVENLKSKVMAFHPSDNIKELIDKKIADWELSFQSEHIRTDKTEIHLYHLFFDFIQTSVSVNSKKRSKK